MGISSITKLLITLVTIALIVLFTVTLWGLSSVEQAIENNANQQVLTETIASTTSLIWVFFTVMCSAVIILGIVFYRAVVPPIEALRSSIIQNGSKLDLTRTIDIEAEGEVGDIVSFYNHLLETVCNSLQNVEDTIFELTEMTEAVDTAARNIVRNSQLQTDASANMSKTIDRVVSGIALVTEQTHTAKDNTAEALEAAAAGTVDIMNTVKGIEIISESVERASHKIKTLRDDSDSISDMAVVIHQIADQTNLLALNAAIEAARAGDQGRGFAVVADEVRGLAQRTAASTQEISKLVIRMQEGTQKAVQSMTITESEVSKGVENAEKAGMSIDRINQGSKIASSTVQEIYDSMQDQQESSANISSRVEQIAQISRKNSSSSGSTAQSIRAIAERSQKLLTVLDNFDYHRGEQKIKLRVADPLGDDHPAVQALHYMANLLKERTNGRIVLTVNSGGALGNDAEVFEKLQAGRIDMMRSNPAILNKAIPETLLLSLPFLFSSSTHMHKAMDGKPGKDILASCSRANLIGLAFYDSGARSVYSNKPINSVSDMAGIKLRVMPSSLWSAVARAMGAEPMEVGMNEIVSAQKMGLIDAAENNLPTFDNFKQHDAFSYFSHTEHAIVPELLIFSKKTWDTLVPEDQAMIEQAAKDSVPEMRRLWNKAEEQAKKHSIKAGVTFVNNIDKGTFQNAMIPVYNNLITTPPLKKLLKEIQEI